VGRGGNTGSPMHPPYLVRNALWQAYGLGDGVVEVEHRRRARRRGDLSPTLVDLQQGGGSHLRRFAPSPRAASNLHHHLQLNAQRKIGTAAGGVQSDGSSSRRSAPVVGPLPERTLPGGGRFQPPAPGCVPSDVGCIVRVSQQGSTPSLAGALAEQ
jgi:hypothetical protein